MPMVSSILKLKVEFVGNIRVYRNNMLITFTEAKQKISLCTTKDFVVMGKCNFKDSTASSKKKRLMPNTCYPVPGYMLVGIRLTIV